MLCWFKILFVCNSNIIKAAKIQSWIEFKFFFLDFKIMIHCIFFNLEYTDISNLN